MTEVAKEWKEEVTVKVACEVQWANFQGEENDSGKLVYSFKACNLSDAAVAEISRLFGEDRIREAEGKGFYIPISHTVPIKVEWPEGFSEETRLRPTGTTGTAILAKFEGVHPKTKRKTVSIKCRKLTITHVEEYVPQGGESAGLELDDRKAL